MWGVGSSSKSYWNMLRDKKEGAKIMRARNYDDVKYFLREMREFHHGSCSAKFVDGYAMTGSLVPEDSAAFREFIGRGGAYVFYSYHTPIAAVRRNESGEAERWFCEGKFSSTTSRHRNIAVSCLG